jgi:DNA repair protein RadA/Sms
MKKKSKGYICAVCGYKSPVKLGKCPNCGSWNSFEEVSFVEDSESIQPVSIEEKNIDFAQDRIKTGIEEFDRVLGGGIVEGSAVLIGGEPGIGKSTLLLQVAGAISQKQKVLYVSGEESYYQIRMRAERLSIFSKNLYIYTEQEINKIIGTISQEKPFLVVIDSIQTMTSQDIEGSPGGLNQVRESTRIFTQIAKKSGMPVILVGHVTKEGTLAGPKTVEHIVDGVFYLEGSRNDVVRLFRSVKNRFGTTNEAGIFEMQEKGLVGVKNPAIEFISQNGNLPVGSAITASLEGTLPIFFEVQALATPTYFPIPRRVANGIEYNRLLLIVAVLEKRLRLKLGGFDIYVNTIGGFKTEDRSMDCALSMAILSTILEKNIPEKTVIMGEIGLGGELRPTVGLERKIKQGERLGFKTFVISSFFKDRINEKGINIIYASDIEEARNSIF